MVEGLTIPTTVKRGNFSRVQLYSKQFITALQHRTIREEELVECTPPSGSSASSERIRICRMYVHGGLGESFVDGHVTDV